MVRYNTVLDMARTGARTQMVIFDTDKTQIDCIHVRPELFYFTDIFRNKLGSEDEIKIKIKFIRTFFQLN